MNESAGAKRAFHATNRDHAVPGTRDLGPAPVGMGLTACLVVALVAAPAAAQTVTVVGTPHFTGLDEPPSAEQLAHTIERLSTFEPTQVCVERMSGERIEVLAGDPARPSRPGSTSSRNGWRRPGARTEVAAP